jgi:signal transduction histidine kinase
MLPPPLSEPAPSRRPPELRTIRVLIIDDDPQAGELIELALAEARFKCTLDVAATAADGLRRVRENAHDIYLVDYCLPDRTGLELIREAKAHGTDKPFILLTGYGSGDLDDAALQEGAADYVEKHLAGAHLDRAIRYALRDWQAEHALREREEQLRHAQKMEAIGRLAGGIAHDFNNLLTAIIGYTDLVQQRFAPSDPAARDVAEIRNAADRAAALTRQLLVLSRKQFLKPVILNLNDSVSAMLQILPRVIGDHITTRADLGTPLPLIKADPAQLEQVILNLVLNARDAMPTGGALTITTQNVEVTPELIDTEGIVLGPGEYVMLAVADSGVGMDADTRSRAFEPFFTTKPYGKGSGLGLASVYGIVEQTGGAIAIDSAPNQGTTVRVYVPVAADAPLETSDGQPVSVRAGGGETILLVDDNDAVRELAKRALERRGYQIVEAPSAEAALTWITKGGTPDLLLTDVIMPGLSGPNLAARVLHQNPRLRVIYMSGYSGDETTGDGPVWLGGPLLQKPFTPTQLADRVRLALDSPLGES